jgi:hypothetical protein
MMLLLAQLVQRIAQLEYKPPVTLGIVGGAQACSKVADRTFCTAGNAVETAAALSAQHSTASAARCYVDRLFTSVQQ